mgnify:CR=1 FL=1
MGEIDRPGVSGRLELGGGGELPFDWGVSAEGAVRDQGDREQFQGMVQGDEGGIQPYLRGGYTRNALANDGRLSRRAFLGLGLYRSLFPENARGDAAVYLGVGGVTGICVECFTRGTRFLPGICTALFPIQRLLAGKFFLLAFARQLHCLHPCLKGS